MSIEHFDLRESPQVNESRILVVGPPRWFRTIAANTHRLFNCIDHERFLTKHEPVALALIHISSIDQPFFERLIEDLVDSRTQVVMISEYEGIRRPRGLPQSWTFLDNLTTDAIDHLVIRQLLPQRESQNSGASDDDLIPTGIQRCLEYVDGILHDSLYREFASVLRTRLSSSTSSQCRKGPVCPHDLGVGIRILAGLHNALTDSLGIALYGRINADNPSQMDRTLRQFHRPYLIAVLIQLLFLEERTLSIRATQDTTLGPFPHIHTDEYAIKTIGSYIPRRTWKADLCEVGRSLRSLEAQLRKDVNRAFVQISFKVLDCNCDESTWP